MSLRQYSVALVLSVSLFLAPVFVSAQTATLLKDGDRVMAAAGLNIRSTPSTSGTLLGHTPTGTSIITFGTIRCELASSYACPTISNGYYWWYVDWDSSTLPSGWSAEGSVGNPYLYVASASLIDLYTQLYLTYSGSFTTTPEDLSQALIDIYSSNEEIAQRATNVIQASLNVMGSVLFIAWANSSLTIDALYALMFAGDSLAALGVNPIIGLAITEFLKYLMAPDLSTGYWNNPIKGALYSNATAGVQTANLALDLLNATGLNNIPTTFLVTQVAPITNSIMPYYATAQGGVGTIKASDTVTGGYGSVEEYTANFTRAQQRLTALVENLLNRGVTYEKLGATKVSGNWAWQTMDLANPLQDFYYRGAAKYDADGNKLMNAYILNCWGPPVPIPPEYYVWPGTYIAGTWDDTLKAGTPYPEAPPSATPAALFTTAKGSGEIEGAQAEGNITGMYGGPLWTALARMGVGGQTMQNLIQQHFDPWVGVRTWDPNIISGFVTETILRDPEVVNYPVWPVCDHTPVPPTPEASKKFIVGDRVQTTATLNVRSTPSTSGTILGNQITGTVGTIVGGPTVANGYNWWNINYDITPDGWSAEDYLIKNSSPPPPPPPPPPDTSTSNSATCGVISALSTLTAGQNFSASVTVNNTGTKLWTSPQYWLSVVTSSGNWADQWVPGGGLDLPFSPVNPEQSVTFNINAVTPTTAGSYNFNWQMIQEGVEFFGPVCSKQITVTSPTSSDTIPPTVSITSPANNATVSGAITISANASDNVGVTKVEFWADGALKFTDTSSPYAWNTTAVTAGPHTLIAKAYDNAGNVGQSSSITVTVVPTVSSATVHYRATLNGAPWSGPIHFISVGTNTTTPWEGTLTFPADIPNAPSGIVWIETYVSGGPSGATFKDITPSATQGITGGDITFTFNFTLVTTSGPGAPCIYGFPGCATGLTCQFTPTTELPYLSTCQPISTNASPTNLSSVWISLMRALEQMKMLVK